MSVSSHPDAVPAHVGIVMDGNGRWAKQRGASRSKGHTAGMRRARRVVEDAFELGVQTLTLFAFSTENINRSKLEVKGLFELLALALTDYAEELRDKGVRLRCIGDVTLLGKQLQRRIEKAEQWYSSEPPKMHLCIAFNYGGRSDIVRAAQKLCDLAGQNQLEGPITEETFASQLWTHPLSDPDLIIRTGDEKRISNFFLWQAAYSELLFTPVLWPDFSRAHFLAAIEEYSQRKRHFGLEPTANAS